VSFTSARGTGRAAERQIRWTADITMTLKLAAVALTCVAFAFSCARDSESYTDRQSPVMLMERFPSYSTERQVVGLIPATALRTVLRENLATSSKQPPLNLVLLSAPNYSHLGYGGELRLEFSNDRLSSVWFFPEKYDEYLAKLNGTGVLVEHVETATIDRNPQIIAHHDERNKRYVTWQDTRLVEQDHRWSERYVRQPQPNSALERTSARRAVRLSCMSIERAEAVQL
jgi:hypothetical protein